MDNIKDFDDDGFELQFEDDTTPEEKKYFVKTYTNVNTVAERRLHCTCCDTHIGTAPSAEKIIRMHPVLHVTQCIKCFRFYNSGEFEKGEDGSELYCRWCGQGGDVYCCSDCPYVFCKKCILRNLTRVALNDVTSNDNWKCFSCAPKILHHLRAQHWALVNFIEKQKKKLSKLQLTLDPDEYADAMNVDASQCCKSKRKASDSPTKKRKLTLTYDSENDSNDSNWNRRKKKKKSNVAESDSDGASVDSERSSKRKRASVAPTLLTAVMTPKASASAAQEKAVSSITKNPNIQIKKVVANPSPARKISQPSITATATVTTAAKPPPAKQPPQAKQPPVKQPQARQPQAKPPPPAKQPQAKQLQARQPPPPTVASTDAAEIDCTPDLFAFLVNHSYEQTVGSTPDLSAENSVSSSTSARAPSTSMAIPASSAANTNSLVNQEIDVPIVAAQPTAAQGQRQYVRRVARYQGTQHGSAPVYHNYNGYRIDLNSASQQSTLRLPNGKVIHVKKQTPLNPGRNDTVRYSITSEVPSSGAQPLPPQPIINQPRPGLRPPIRSGPHSVQRISAGAAATANMHPRMANQVRPTILSRAVPPGPPPLIINSVSSGVPMPPANSMQSLTAPGNAAHMGLQQAQMQMQQMMRQPTANTGPRTMHASNAGPRAMHASNAGPRAMQATNAGPAAPAPTTAPVTAASASAAAVAAQANIPLPRIYGSEPVGQARTQLERQIFNAIQICHQIDGKLKTLMNSNAYKNAKKMHDIKELYIHLSYLFTYTNGRFQSVHDKCMEDMRRLGFKNDATSLSSGNVIDKYGSDVDEDDLEIVEPNHQTIDVVDSDDERTPEKSKSKGNTTQKSAAAAIAMNFSSRASVTAAAAAAANVHVLQPASSTEPGTQAMLDITSSTENVETMECDVDITSLLQIDMNEQEEDDENGESLLRRMNDDVGIATPPDFEQHEEINIQNDVKLNSKVTVILKPVEQDFPDLVQKARQKMNDIQAEAAEQSRQAETEAETANETHNEAEIDGAQQQEPTENETEPNQDESVQEKIDTKINNDVVETVNLDDSIESVSSDVECTTSNVGDSDELKSQKEADNQVVDAQIEEQTPLPSSPHEIDQSLDKQNDTVAEIEPDKGDQQNDQDSVELIEDEGESPPQQPESQAEQNEANDGLVETTQHDETDFTENEAKSIDDDNSNDCVDKAADVSDDAECHGNGEITSTNDENENDVEAMHEILDDENTATCISKMNDCQSDTADNAEMNDCQSDTGDNAEMDECHSATGDNTGMNDCQSDTADNAEMNECQSDTGDNAEMNECHSGTGDNAEINEAIADDDVDDEDTSVLNDIAGVIASEEVIAEEVIAEEVITTEMLTDDVIIAADECIALEETVGGDNDGDAGGSGGENEQPNETESIFSDLSGELVNEEINNVISTSASLDVASLLESGDFENISSPEAFN